MSLIKKDSDDLVKEITCYNSLPLFLHGYITPFVIIYSSLTYLWIQKFQVEENSNIEIWYFLVGLSVLFQILLFLSCHWSVKINCLLAYKKVKNVENAKYVKVVPTKNNGFTEIRVLNKYKDHNDQLQIYFYFQKTKYIFNHETQHFSQLNFPVNETINYYLNSRGYSNTKDLEIAEKKYGKNDLEMNVPEFLELFKERAIAPFFIFQVFCVLLWCLDEYWYYSLLTLFLLILFECVLVYQQLRNLSEIRKMGKKPYNLHVYRFQKWQTIMSSELIPGDLINVSRCTNDNNLVPCDLLLLKGSCIVDESMLTGESVPQIKEGVDNLLEKDQKIDINNDLNGKLHILYGGTKILQHTAPQKANSQVKTYENGCLAYVLKTSFNTSQGKLLRTILFGVKRVTENNLETFFFILFLLIFAIIAAAYLWIEGSKDPDRNRFKLFLECTLILTSVVPPELPIELSLAVNTSLLSLVKMNIFCTEPFRIPFAGKIEICCFDKTGTLTSDNLVLEGIAGLTDKDFKKTYSVSDLPQKIIQVMASCHSLVQLDNDLVGDPLEKATLNAINWTVQKNDFVTPKKGKAPGIKIIHRFYFSSTLKRMSVIASYVLQNTNEAHYFASVKGAPETLKNMFVDLPKNYDEVYIDLSKKGARVIALGRKDIGIISQEKIKEMKREDVEKNLEFVGFAVISTPLKPDSKYLIKEILDSNHRVVMITGDAPLTACHVAKELNFVKRKKTLILTKSNENDDIYLWKPIDQDITIDLIPENLKKFVKIYDLCLTGTAISFLINNKTKLFNELLPFVKVWARVAPKQKEFIITSLRSQGYYVLMCGDGTNDVGALKHAHAGIALIANAPLTLPSIKSKSNEVQDPKSLVNENSVLAKSIKILNKKPKNASDYQNRVNDLKKIIDEIKEQEKTFVKLGDASIAAPFTSKLSSIKCVCDIIKQGRCTLVTTLQMFKILALNALILAYCQSVLHLDGVKMNDYQATIQSLLLSGCFFFISRSKPLKTLSHERPLPDIFNFYTILTVLLQFLIHFSCLVFLVNQAKIRSPITHDVPKKENATFEANLLNSTLYVISICFQINTFAVNYKGHPFMESIAENKQFMWSILITLFVIVSVVTGSSPQISEHLYLVNFEGEFQKILIITLLVDFFGAFIVDRILLNLIGKGNLKKELQN